MCGITACFGTTDAVKNALTCLRKLEYRGYDSFGFAWQSPNGISLQKFVGKMEGTFFPEFPSSRSAIAHTRWATHGSVTPENAHPHLSNSKAIAVVHNGIIENFAELKVILRDRGFVFYSQTDTEVVANLIEWHTRSKKNFVEAVRAALLELEGSFALAILEKNTPGFILAKKEAPLVIGLTQSKTVFAASDPVAVLDFTHDLIFLNDFEMAYVSDAGVSIIDIRTNKPVQKKTETVQWSPEQAQKGNFAHFMLKEIFDQPFAIKNALRQDPVLLEKAVHLIQNAKSVFLIGSGSSYHASLLGAYWFSEIASQNAQPILASEFESHVRFVDAQTVLLVSSQSGETADVLMAVKQAKEKGAKLIALCNSQSSTLVRLADISFSLNCGPELCVLATKSYAAQLTLFLYLAYGLANRWNEGKQIVNSAGTAVLKFLSKENLVFVEELAKRTFQEKNYFVIGRGLMYSLALESALKIKEASYIHAEGFAGAELKHGTIALIESETPVIALASAASRKQLLSNALEVKARGALVIGMDVQRSDVYDVFFEIPDVQWATPLVTLVPVQLLAYYLAVEKGLDPDKPRNLAKCVTVL